MKDPVFGEIDWHGGYWRGDVTLPYFRGYGQDTNRVYQDPSQPADPFGFDEDDEDELDREDAANLKKGKFELLIATAGGERLKPTDAQRQAWAIIRGRRDAVWDELMARLLEAYRRQRPERVRRWRAVYGDYGLDRMIPDLKTVRGLKKLVRPMEVVVQPCSVPPAQTPDVLVQFVGVWLNSGFAAVVRDGRVAEFVSYSAPDREKDPVRFTHPAMGRLRWNDHYGAWIGDLKWDGLESFAKVAPLRAAFEADRARFKNPGTPEDWFWETLDGRFTTVIHVNDAELPTARQAEAYAAFCADGARHAGAIANAVVKECRRSGLSPAPKNGDEVREHLDVASVNIFPDDPKDPAGPAIGVDFYGPEDTRFGVCVRNGKVEAVGDESVAEPRRRKNTGKRPVLPESAGPSAATPPAGGKPPPGADQVTLRFKSGTSDKVYQVEILPKGNGHVVNFAFGRHGGKLNTGTKTTKPVPLARAREIFNELVSEKTAKGYGPQSPAGAPTAPAKPVAPTPPAPRGRPTYTLKVVKEGWETGLELKSPHLDPALHPDGTLRIPYYDDPKDPIDPKNPKLDAFEEATVRYYLRNQASIRKRLEDALADDQEERGADDGQPVRGDVWSWAELLYFRFDAPNPKRKHVPKVAFHLVFSCAWEEEHHVVAEFEDDKLKPITIE